MPLPNIHIAFQHAASTAVQRSQKGTVALIVRDPAALGPLRLTAAAQIPKDLEAANAAYLSRAFIGHVSAPRQVLAYVLDEDADSLDQALAWLATQRFDYLAGPPDITQEECAALKAWIAAQREAHQGCKAVLPHTAANSEGIINFTTDSCKTADGQTLDAAQMCSRMAGLIAGTPMREACTYAPLPELSDCKRLSQAAGDAAVDAGELILIHDGVRVKVGRAVNSLTAAPDGKSQAYRKIKIIELLDMLALDVRRTIADSYIGRPNSYDEKLVLVTAVRTYFEQLEQESLLQKGGSSVGVDVRAQAAWLAGQGVDVAALSEQEIKEHNTGSHVFLSASVSPLDAIEDVSLLISM